MQKLIISFWKGSLNGSLSKYDFSRFFNAYNKLLKDKLAGHGQLTFDDYVEHVSKYYDLNLLRRFEYVSIHAEFSMLYPDIIKAVFFKRYTIFRNKNRKHKRYITMLKVYNAINDYKNLSHTDKVLLVDKCISLQHNSNFIVGLNISELRRDFENGKYN